MSDIHDDVTHLRGALAELASLAVDQVVVLGDTLTCSGPTHAEEVVRLLVATEAIGVWGNHDMGLCRDVSDDVRDIYDLSVLTFMSTLRPQLDFGGCFFSHVDPWLDPRDITQLWYFGGSPDTPEKAARSFAAVPHRFLFLGHFHQWLLMTPSCRIAWDGTEPILLGGFERCLIVVAPVFNGHCAVFDTERAQLTPLSWAT